MSEWQVKDIDYGTRLHEAAMLRGSKLLLSVLRGHTVAPTKLVWTHGFKPDNWQRDEHSFTSERHERLCSDSLEKRHHAAGRRIAPRDPCSYCGIRADVGCRHRRVA
jgi:hypothetical protein